MYLLKEVFANMKKMKNESELNSISISKYYFYFRFFCEIKLISIQQQGS